MTSGVSSILLLLPPLPRAQCRNLFSFKWHLLLLNCLRSHLIAHIGLVHFEVLCLLSCLWKHNPQHLLRQTLLPLLPKKSSPNSQPFRLSSLKPLLNSRRYLIFKMLNRSSPATSGPKMLLFLPFPTNLKKPNMFLTCSLMIILTTVALKEPSQWMMQTIPPKLQSRLSDILSYAHKISCTTFAPPEFSAGQGPLRGALPPAPQDEQMHASELYNFADRDIGLPKTEEGKEKIIDAIIETPAAPPAESNPLASLSAIQGLNPSKLVAPPGWKPGMPVELPIDLSALPPPPPGWKPGDPLPPLDALPLPPRVEEQPRPGPPPGLVKAPESIQVRHVQLDIEDAVVKIVALMMMLWE